MVYAAIAGPGASATTSPSAAASSTSSLTSASSAGESSQNSSSSSTITKKGSFLCDRPIADIAIGIGALILLSAAFVRGVWFIRRKNKTAKSDPSTGSIWGKAKTPFGVSELGSTGPGRYEIQGDVPEKDANFSYVPLSEMPAHQ